MSKQKFQNKQSKKFHVFVTRQIPHKGIDFLKRFFDVRVFAGKDAPPKKVLYQHAAKADALLCLLTDHIDRNFLEHNRHLRIVGNYAVGFDNIDVKAATQLGILITNTPNVLDDAVAEHALSLMCAISRRIVEGDRFIREGKYKGWEPMLFLGSDFFDKKLGIVGMGRIGESFAKRACQGLAMKILYTDVKPHPEFERKYNAHYVSLETLLKNADFVSLHVPLLPSTHHLIGARQLRLMKKTAYLINTSRGPVIDEKALVATLKRKQIAGAALDVFENEPLLASGLTKLSNVVLTPHIASATVAARDTMAVMTAQGIIDALHGRKPHNLVDPLAWRRYLVKFAP